MSSLVRSRWEVLPAAEPAEQAQRLRLEPFRPRMSEVLAEAARLTSSSALSRSWKVSLLVP